MAKAQATAILDRLLGFAALFQIHGGGGEGKVHAVFLHQIHQVQIQVILHLQKAVHLGGAQVSGHQQIDAGSAEAAQLYQHQATGRTQSASSTQPCHFAIPAVRRRQFVN